MEINKISDMVKIICKIDDCIYNTNKNCRKTEITIDWDGTPTCFDYEEDGSFE